jgi:hypothetical protein
MEGLSEKGWFGGNYPYCRRLCMLWIALCNGKKAGKID